jgi:hypothetical protein
MQRKEFKYLSMGIKANSNKPTKKDIYFIQPIGRRG